MSKGPQGQKRPADVVGCAVSVAKIATGEAEETLAKKSGRVRSGRAGAKARAESLTNDERRKIAKKAAAARWG
ncbi:MAG: RNA-binding protein [Proteobacteria bacterium]|nr:RNA-binding protein [Pseudomonadota bacterium]